MGMLYLGVTVLVVVLVIALLALARVITNWLADR